MPEGDYVKTWREKPGKFYRDSEGNYWEARDIGNGRKFMVPAPPWAGYINFYLFEGPDIIVERHMKPLCDVPVLRGGSTPRDGGNLILTDEQKKELLRTDPLAEKFLRPFMMGRDFLYNAPRWCLWMVGAEPADIRNCPHVLERIERVREFRLKSKREATKKLAETPMLFSEIRYSTTDYLAIPMVSSHKRKYIPIGWLSSDVIAGNHLFMCANSTLYQFGVLSSSVHNAWLKLISGRFGVSINYSNTLDYNAFPWPGVLGTRGQGLGTREQGLGGRELDPKHYDLISQTAQAILDARSLYPRSSLADLYDERTMPPELRKAHNANDEAVMAAYEFVRHYEDERLHDEDIAVNLLYMYKELSGCEERTRHYPNLELWLKYYPEDAEELGVELEDED